jgi:hypothetical protein
VIRCMTFTRMLGWHLRKYWYRWILCHTSYETVYVVRRTFFISVACYPNCWRPTMAQMEQTCRCCHFKVSWTAMRRLTTPQRSRGIPAFQTSRLKICRTGVSVRANPYNPATGTSSSPVRQSSTVESIWYDLLALP